MYADIPEGVGSEQNGYRPVLIIQNNTGNKHSPTTIVALISKCVHKYRLPTHVIVRKQGMEPSMVMCEQIRTIDKKRLKRKLAVLENGEMEYVDEALKISLGLEG